MLRYVDTQETKHDVLRKLVLSECEAEVVKLQLRRLHGRLLDLERACREHRERLERGDYASS